MRGRATANVTLAKHINVWPTYGRVWGYLIFVTTITTAGCVKNLAKCKNFQMEREELLYTKCKIWHTVLSQFMNFQVWNFLAWSCNCVKKMKLSGMGGWALYNCKRRMIIFTCYNGSRFLDEELAISAPRAQAPELLPIAICQIIYHFTCQIIFSVI